MCFISLYKFVKFAGGKKDEQLKFDCGFDMLNSFVNMIFIRMKNLIENDKYS